MRCSPALVGSLETESLLQPPAIRFCWNLIGNLELRNLIMSIDAYTEKHKFTCFYITRNPCPNKHNLIQRHNYPVLALLLSVLQPVKMGRSLRPSEGRYSTSRIITAKLLQQEAATGALPSKDTMPEEQLPAILCVQEHLQHLMSSRVCCRFKEIASDFNIVWII